MVGCNSIPTNWLQLILEEKFFIPCLVHEFVKKNEKNIFCLDCCTSFCLHCLDSHHHHRLLQIRRYVYHDVLRLDDAEKLMNCSLVQTYITNSAKVVFLNQRPMTRPFRASSNICTICDRNLHYPYMFCSLACKMQYLMNDEDGTRNLLYDCNVLQLPYYDKQSFSELEYGQMTPESVLDSPVFLRTSSGSSASGGGVGVGVGAVSCRTLACTATTEFVKKKRSTVTVPRVSFRPTWPAVMEVSVAGNNRRKGVPHRSPLC